jgi:hypothetical protein
MQISGCLYSLAFAILFSGVFNNNGNGLPDEMWYELPGGEENHFKWKNYITSRYILTYFKKDGYDSINEYGQKIREVYWSDFRGWVGMIPGDFPGNINRLDTTWGVVGNWVTYICILLRDDGIPANLSAVKFLKVQTGMFRYGGIFGDVSTEIVEADFLEYQAGGFPMP